LTSLTSGTTFSWTVAQTGTLTGGSSGTGSTIAQLLTNSGIITDTATYSVASTANGCTGNPITVLVYVKPRPIGTATPTSQTLCSGDSTSIILTSNIPGTSFPWTVFRSGGVTGGLFGSDSLIHQTLTNLGSSSGNAIYSVVPSLNGCAGTPVPITITVNPKDSASFVYSSATYCVSGNDPTPTITGMPGGTFSSTPAGLIINPTTGKITLATSLVGVYNLCYSTSGICPNSSCITMTIDNSTPFAGFSYIGSPFCQNGTNPLPVFGTGASAGVFSVTPIGLTFVHINTGEIDLANSAPGTYTVTNSIPPSGPCGAVTANTIVVITASDNASFVYTSATYCTTGSPQTPVVTGLSGGTFSSAPAGLTINPSTGTITLSTSAYGVYLLSYTTNGPCPSTSSITMTIDTITPSASFSYIGSPFCQNGINPFPLFGTNASAGFFSATPAGLSFAHVNTGEIDLASSTAGTYVVTNTIPASGICLPISATFTVTITASDDASFTYPSATYCTTGPNQTPSITGMVGGVFTSLPPGLTLNPTTGTITLSTSAVGSYTLTYSTNGSCPNSSSIIMTIADSTPFANFSYSSTIFCQNAINQYPTFIPGASAGTFTSSPAGLVIVHVNTGEIDLANSATGTYTVTNTIPASGVCTAVSATTTVTINPADDAAFTYPSATYCTSGTPQTPTITGLPGGTFSSIPTGLSLNPSTGTITLSSSIVGSYTLSYTTFGSCPNTSSITMTINDTMSSATFSYIGSPFCQSGGANPFPAFVPGSSAGIFSATPSGLVFAHVNTGEINMTASAPGTYIVTNTIPMSGSCAFVSANYTITINAAPVATATATSQAFCGSGTASVSIALTSTIPGTTFSWTVLQSGLTGGAPGSGSTISQTLTNQVSPATAVYTITPDASGCTGAPTTITIIVSPSIVDTTSVVIVPANCGTTTGGISGITMTAGQSPFVYQWNDSLNAPVGDGSSNLSNVGPGNYSVTITDGNGCSVVVGPFTVISTPAVVAAFTATPITGETPLSVTFTNNSIGAATYLWQFGTGDSSTTSSPTYVYNPLGAFKVCLTAISASNCIDSVCSTIDVFINSVFIIPNIFTPNGDDINDVFTVQAVGLKTMDAEIFNRWGEKIYEWHTTNGGWDGYTTSGLPAADGTYYYIISATGIDAAKYFEKGYFTLLRNK
jgi:gliding motility-associated-like protein